jgi:protein TonB
MLNLSLPARVRAACGTAIAVALMVGAASVASAAQPATPDATDTFSYRKMDAPQYPQEAIDAHQSGVLTFKVLVDEKGVPRSVNVVDADPPEAERVFADVSIAAVKQWRFNPPIKNGRPEGGYVEFPITFSLDNLN